MGLNYATLENVSRITRDPQTMPTNLRLVVWPVDRPADADKPLWWAVNRAGMARNVYDIRASDDGVIGTLDYGVHGIHTVFFVLGSYITTVPYLATSYAHAAQYTGLGRVQDV